ncbi:branched-chain amino acid transport system ATP-binding protein [Palleronia aestuarii]|uniref:Branched-chain amino acid transport system ATP-binding protein n=1 Tax=Palleronia aestuarii TaxID=568105 RepID=A0A2W7MST2_9RHOB|nr:ABC transporter ATP-binding protein [Palleronia aestuarii]PZX10561.1 branched-chain amino acid transport system ATP-binding protein [Palleronia aestuarii]
MDEPILDVRNVDLGYGALTVVYGASLSVGPGELVGLVGGNGSGKSTILRAVSGMIGQKKGEIRFDGERVADSRPHRMARRGLAHIPMGRQLFGEMTVRDNLLLGATLPEARAKRDQTLAEVEALFPDLARFSEARAAELSGGQQQMVAIARGLMLRPRMLLMDEPSLGLAPIVVKEAMRAIRKVANTGMPILLVEQNVKQVLDIADRAYVLENGRMVLDGTAEDLRGDDRVRRAYLGI